MTDKEKNDRIETMQKLATIGDAANALAVTCNTLGVQPEDIIEMVVALAKKRM